MSSGNFFKYILSAQGGPKLSFLLLCLITPRTLEGTGFQCKKGGAGDFQCSPLKALWIHMFWIQILENMENGGMAISIHR